MTVSPAESARRRVAVSQIVRALTALSPAVSQEALESAEFRAHLNSLAVGVVDSALAGAGRAAKDRTLRDLYATALAAGQGGTPPPGLSDTTPPGPGLSDSDGPAPGTVRHPNL